MNGAAFAVFQAAVCSGLAFGAAYWIIASWMDRRLAAWEAGGLLAALVVGMFFIVAYTLQNGLAALALVVVVGGGLVWAMSLYAKVADRRLHQQFDEEDIAKYTAALDLDPKNVAAHSLLADLYRRQGRLEEALAEYREAVRLSPELQKERYWIDRLMLQIEHRAKGKGITEPQIGRDSPCPDCGAIIPGTEVACSECGRYVGKG